MNIFFLADLVDPNTSITAILPELVVAATGVIVMLYDSFYPKQRKFTGIASLVGLVLSGLLLALMYSGSSPATSWNGMIAHDNLRLGFSFVFLLVSALTVLVSAVWVDVEDVPVGEDPVIVAEQPTRIPKMSVSDAVMRMDLSGQTAILFRNPKNNQLNMLYRRADGNIGWVEPDLSVAAE